jgi:putative phage-type endonuclease|nr:MAG TPA: Exonuclease [Caudoviricetes sp.]
MTVKELREEAKSLGLVGYSRLKKAELEELIATAKAEVIEMTKDEFKESLDTNNEVYEYANDDDWHTLREKRIGGSDIGAILGVNPYKSIIDVYIDKTEGSTFKGNNATHWGHMLESTIIKEFASRHKELQVFDAPFSIVDNFLIANLDAVLRDKENGNFGVLEIKTTSLWNKKEWEEDTIPQSYYAQVQHYLMLTGYKFAYVAVLIGGQEYKEFKVERNEEDIELIRNKSTEFYNENLLKKIPPMPDGSDAYMQHLKKKALDVENDEVIEFSYLEEKAQKVKDLGKEMNSLKKEQDLLKEQIMLELINNGTQKGVAGKLKFNIQTKKSPDLEAMIKANAKLVEQYKELESKHQKTSKFLAVR